MEERLMVEEEYEEHPSAISFKEYVDKYKSFTIPVNGETVKSVLSLWGHAIDPSGYNRIAFVHKIIANNKTGSENYQIDIFTDNEEIFKKGESLLTSMLEARFGVARRYKVNIVKANCIVI